MEVHSHGPETLGVSKEADKVFNPELKDILPPASSQIPAGEDFTVPPSEHPPDLPVKEENANNSVPVKDENANNSVGGDLNAIPPAAFSFPSATSDLNSTPDISFQPFETGGLEQNSQNEIHQVGEQDVAFDDMVMLENDVVTSASLAGGPGDTMDTFQVTDIQMEGFQQAPTSDVFNAPSVTADITSVEVNGGETIEHPSTVQVTEVSVTLVSDVTTVSVVAQEEAVTEAAEVKVVEAVHDLPSAMEDGLPAVPTSDGVEAKSHEIINPVETVTPPDGETAQKSEPPQESEPAVGNHGVTDEDIQAIKGQKVFKKFGRKKFGGEVVDFDPETKWFKVVYEDGDEEDLEVWEVKQIVASSSSASSSKKRPRVDGGADGSSGRSSVKPKKKGAESSTVKKVRTGSKSAAKSPKTPGTKARGSESAKKPSTSKKSKSPGKLIKRALNSSAFKTPASSQVKEGKGKGKAGTLTPKSRKGGSAKKTKSGTVSRSLNLQTPKSQGGKDKASVESSVSKKGAKSSGLKRKAADQGKTSLEKSKKSKKAVIEAGGDTNLVGKRVKKDFDGTLYDGVVLKFDKKTQFYKVKYADGDQEDLELHELEAILVQDLENTEEKDDKPAKLSSLSSLMSAGNVSGAEKRK